MERHGHFLRNVKLFFQYYFPPLHAEPLSAPGSSEAPSFLSNEQDLPCSSAVKPQPRCQHSQKSTSSASKSGDSLWSWPDLSRKEVEMAVKSSSAGKAPGPDRIGFSILHHAYAAVPDTFAAIYSMFFNYGYHPRCWRKGIGVVLPKPNKEDYSIPKSYRVIALLNCLGKVLEKIIASRLSYLANTTGLLHHTQLGGRKQRSAVDAVLLLQHYIQQERSKRKGNVTSTLFLDIKGAFDHVSKPKLLSTMQRLDLPSTLVSWVSSFLSERVIRLMFDGRVQDETPVDIGIPQGSPISPILFLIYTRDVWQDRAFQISYIDDFSLAVSSTSAKKNCRALKDAAETLLQHASGKGVHFDPGKTELVHFHTRRKPESEGLTINGCHIQPKTLVRWLGVWLDVKLSFKQHVEKKINSATAAFFALQRLGSLQKGLSVKALRQLYMACITATADYGVPLWYTNNCQGLLLSRYQRLQNMAVRHILGAFKGSPTKALELEAALLPPQLRFEKQCYMYALRTLQFQPDHPISQALSNLTEDELGDKTGDASNIAYIPQANTQLLTLLQRAKKLVKGNWNIEKPSAKWEAPWAAFPAEFSVSKHDKKTEARAHMDLLQELQRFERQSTRIYYTDGSQIHAATSAAVCRLGTSGGFDVARHWYLGRQVEVADAEVFAVAKALALASQDRAGNVCKVYVFVDSQAAIARLERCRGHEIVQEAWAAAEVLRARGTRVCIQWCPSHTGIPGNEMADTLARKGLEDSDDKQRKGPVSLPHLRRVVRMQILTAWKDQWQAQERNEEQGKRATGMGRLYRLVSKDSLAFSLHPSKSLISLPKTIVSAYIQLKTGKGLLKSFQYTIGKALNDECFCGTGKRQDTRHLLLECKEYKMARCRLKKRLKNIPLQLNVLFCTSKGQVALAQFLQETRICITGWQENIGSEED